METKKRKSVECTAWLLDVQTGTISVRKKLSIDFQQMNHNGNNGYRSKLKLAAPPSAKSARVCSAHFVDADYKTKDTYDEQGHLVKKKTSFLVKDAVPSVIDFSTYTFVSTLQNQPRRRTYQRPDRCVGNGEQKLCRLVKYYCHYNLSLTMVLLYLLHISSVHVCITVGVYKIINITIIKHATESIIHNIVLLLIMIQYVSIR